ncbi:MAG TPA: integrase core domain-containing protein, partial [Gaiellales bacterium]
RTTSSSQLISQNGLPIHVSQQRPLSRNTIIPAGPDTVSSPDNGAYYVSTLHAIACHQLGLRHLRTRPRRPRTNGKAERFIRTLLAGWAYAAIYANSQERADALDGWLYTYNHTRPHGNLGHQPPLRRLQALTENNLPGSYS